MVTWHCPFCLPIDYHLNHPDRSLRASQTVSAAVLIHTTSKLACFLEVLKQNASLSIENEIASNEDVHALLPRRDVETSLLVATDVKNQLVFRSNKI